MGLRPSINPGLHSLLRLVSPVKVLYHHLTPFLAWLIFKFFKQTV